MAECSVGSPWSFPDAAAVYVQLKNSADTAVGNANSALETLSDYISDLNNTDPETDLDFDAPTASGEIAPIPPVTGAPTPVVVGEPTPIGDITCFVPTSLGNPPTDDVGTLPTISWGNKPDDLDAVAPTEPTIDYNVIDVDEPTYTDPTLGTLETITIPSLPTIDWPSLDLDEPEWAGPDYPDYEINFSEQFYSSDLRDAVYIELLDWVQNGGTGLHADIESQIWDRARSREDQNSFRVRKKLTIENPASGWAYPTGSLYESILAAEQEAQNKIADLSREIAIEQANLEQKNIHFAIENSIKYESMMIDYWNKINDRALEAQKIIAELAVQVYRTYIERYKADMQKYQTQAQVYTEQIKAEIAKIEVFKAQIDAQRLISEVNKNTIDAYIAQWQAVKTQAEVFATKVEYAKALLEAEALKAQVYKTQIEAYAEEVRAYVAEWQAYTEEIKAEATKMEVYGVKADVFFKRMQGWAAKAGLIVEQDKLKLQNISLFIDKYKAYVDAYKAWSSTQVGYYQAQVGYFNGQAEHAKAVAQNNEAIGKQDFANALAKQEEVKWETDREFAQQAQNLSRLIEIDKMIGDVAKSLATISAQLATAAWSTINVGINAQQQQSQSFNCNESHNYQEK